MLRGFEASGARYAGLAEHFAEIAAGTLRGFDATGARYTGLAAHFGARNEVATEAEIARWNGLAEYYGEAGN